MRFRIDTRLSFDGDRLTDGCIGAGPLVPFVPFMPFVIVRSSRPFITTLLALIACCACEMACFTWKPCGCRILENGRGLNSSIEFGFRGSSGGDKFSKLLVFRNGLRVDDDPAKLFRRLAVFTLFSVSDVWRMCRRSSGGGGGNGSS